MLDVKRLRLQAFRWSVFSAALIGAYWAIRWLTGHQVPLASAVFGIELPFTISRWWDIAAGPLMSGAICLTIWIIVTYDIDMPGDERFKGTRDWIGMLGGMIIFVLGEMFVGINIFFSVSALLGTLTILLIIPVAAVVTGFTGYYLAAALGCCCTWLWRWVTVQKPNKLKLVRSKAA